MTAAAPAPVIGSRWRVAPVTDHRGASAFAGVARHVYRHDVQWTPPLPSELRDTFDPATNPPLARTRWCRWVLTERDSPRGRIAAFAPAARPGVGYFGFFECPDDPALARALVRTAEAWLAERGRHEIYGPVAVTPRDTIGLLIEGFGHPALLFTPYNPAYYPALLLQAGWALVLEPVRLAIVVPAMLLTIRF